ncbi:glycosyltransferase family 2 protein [Thermophagus sp. OGC60D27]|uniref:glycosyltransferase family 2 protein n=1 Tax=Thermophagus sp. OGC60D27 TaxID=3458415 RepID=UPI00403791FA
MDSEYTLTVIVPVFNEKENLPGLKKELDKFLMKSNVNAKVLFVDDHSDDGSLDLIKQFTEENRELYEYLSLHRNSGLSTALKAGFDHVDTPFVAYIDADLQTHPMDFLLFFPYMKKYTMVNGIRQNRSDSLVKRLSSQIANAFRRWMIKDNIKDTCCPLKIINTQAIKEIPFFKGMHRFIPALILLKGGTVKEVPVRHFPRLAGEAKYHLWNRLVGPLMDTFAFVWMRKRNIIYKIQERS